MHLYDVWMIHLFQELRLLFELILHVLCVVHQVMCLLELFLAGCLYDACQNILAEHLHGVVFS